jgi:hypothetical protein
MLLRLARAQTEGAKQYINTTAHDWLERFRFTCSHLKIMSSGIFFHPTNQDLSVGPRLGKMPLDLDLSVKGRIETAVAAFEPDLRLD